MASADGKGLGLLRRLQIGSVKRPLEFRNCPEVADAFLPVLRGWTVRELASGTDAPEAALVMERKDDVYSWDMPWTGASSQAEPVENLVDAVCDLHYQLVDWYLEDNQEKLCLYCAAVEINGGLVLFPSAARAGKSTLSVALAHAGHRIFGDDRVAIGASGENGYSLGTLPRLRLPLPLQAMEGDLKEFIAAHEGLHDEERLYVDLPEALFAPLNESSPIRGIVLLSRTNRAGPATLSPASRADCLRALAEQNFNRRFSASEIFERLLRTVSRGDRFALRYRNLKEAVELLEQAYPPSSGQPNKAVSHALGQ